MFNENSGLVQTWIRLILEGKKTEDDIPNISNLKEIIVNLLK